MNISRSPKEHNPHKKIIIASQGYQDPQKNIIAPTRLWSHNPPTKTSSHQDRKLLSQLTIAGAGLSSPGLTDKDEIIHWSNDLILTLSRVK